MRYFFALKCWNFIAKYSFFFFLQLFDIEKQRGSNILHVHDFRHLIINLLHFRTSVIARNSAFKLVHSNLIYMNNFHFQKVIRIKRETIESGENESESENGNENALLLLEIFK